MPAPNTIDPNGEQPRQAMSMNISKRRGTGSKDDPLEFSDEENNDILGRSSATRTQSTKVFAPVVQSPQRAAKYPQQDLLKRSPYHEAPFSKLNQRRLLSLDRFDDFESSGSPTPSSDVLRTAAAIDNEGTSSVAYQLLNRSNSCLPEPSNSKCLNCRDLELQCDGEQPCTPCAEPGLPCLFPGRVQNKTRENLATVSDGSQHKNKIFVPNVDKGKGLDISLLDNSISTQKSFRSIRSRSHNSDIQLHDQEQVPISRYCSEDAALLSRSSDDDTDYESDESSEFPEMEHGPMDPVEIHRLVKEIESDLKTHQTRRVQSILRQARRDTYNSSGQALECSKADPFHEVKGANIVPSDVSKRGDSGSRILQIQTKSFGKLSQTSKSKWNHLSVHVKETQCHVIKLPKYKSITRMAPSILARNVRTAKYRPYDPSDEPMEDAALNKKYNELMQRYDHNDPSMRAQRKCLELVDLWQPWADDLMKKFRLGYSDIIYYYTNVADRGWRPDIEMSDAAYNVWASEQRRACETCEVEGDSGYDIELAKAIKSCSIPDGRSFALAGLLSHAFHNVSRVSLWHLAMTSRDFKATSPIANKAPKTRDLPKLCTVCYLHNCPTHGVYFEPDGDDPSLNQEALINDEEAEYNLRQTVSLPSVNKRQPNHLCGVYCVDKSLFLSDLLGRYPDGIVKGVSNHTFPPASTSKDRPYCSNNCFWDVKIRRNSKLSELAKGNLTPLSLSQSQLFTTLLPLYVSNKRGPCIMATMMDDVSCLNIFYHMLKRIGRIPHKPLAADDGSLSIDNLQQGRKVAKVQAGLDTSMSAELDSRAPFVPCSHDGPCQNNSDCTCAEDKVSCEPFCGCNDTCKRRFKGCLCAGISKTCFNDARCECWVQNRECDPWLCKSCGVIEVLHSSNKYNEEIRKGRCNNNRIQLDLPARTIKAPSEVQGYGLFAGEDLQEHAYIGEYRGEITSISESDRRGAVYHILGAEYLFVINRDQEMDASNMGNKMRFMNNSQDEANINVIAKKMLCNGIQRVMLYTKQSIRAGEELLYNYNYPVAVTKNFWERGEQPTTSQGAVVSIMPKTTLASQPRSDGHIAKTGDTTTSISTSQMQYKRKWNVQSSSSSPGGLESATAEAIPVQVIDASDDSDFAAVEDDLENNSSEDELPYDSEDDTSRPIQSVRKRKIRPGDRRYGGKPQAEAWRTRKKNYADQKGFVKAPPK